jgi:hypothetical protein
VANIEDRSYKLLGIYFDEHLTFDKQNEILCAKLARANFFLRRVQKCILPNHLKDLYFALFHSHLLYCINIYTCTSKKNIQRIHILQKKAIRIINSAKSNSHTDPFFKKCNILPFPNLIKYSNLKLMHSLVYKYGPTTLINSVIKNEDRNTGHVLRNQEIMYVPTVKTEIFKRFPLYILPSSWNAAGNLIFYSNPITFRIALFMNLLSSELS